MIGISKAVLLGLVWKRNIKEWLKETTTILNRAKKMWLRLKRKQKKVLIKPVNRLAKMGKARREKKTNNIVSKGSCKYITSNHQDINK